MTLVKSLHSGDPNVICLTLNTEKAKSVQLFGVQPSAVHSSCSCMFMYVHVTHALGGAMWRPQALM
jgi:hypothetical protein